MPGYFEKEDLRILKTHNALTAAMSKLLGRQNFNQITINDICEEALISRSTFYSHFQDKYDLLEYWLTEMKLKIRNDQHTYEDIEKSVNEFANSNKSTIKNLMEKANSETSELLCDFLLSLLKIETDETDKEPLSTGAIVLSSVCCGGMLNYLLWQVKNNFPAELPVMNPYIYDLLFHCQKCGDAREHFMSRGATKQGKQLKAAHNDKCQ